MQKEVIKTLSKQKQEDTLTRDGFQPLCNPTAALILTEPFLGLPDVVFSQLMQLAAVRQESRPGAERLLPKLLSFRINWVAHLRKDRSLGETRVQVKKARGGSLSSRRNAGNRF